METKQNLSRRGCLAFALPDEPMFILLARDPDAPAAIRSWCERRARRQVLEPTIELVGDSEKIVDAVDDAEAFEKWRAENEGSWRGVAPSLLIEMIPDDELEDLIADAIADSMDVDWNSRTGARAVVRALRRETR